MALDPQPFPGAGGAHIMPAPRPIEPQKRDPLSGDSYLKKLNALLPGELTAAYVALRGLAGDDPDLQKWVFVSALILCILFFFFLPRMLRMEAIFPRFLYCFTFLVWIISLDNRIWAEEVFNLQNQQALFLYGTSAFAVIWSFSLPYLFDSRNPD